ncbi:MAG TPA: 2-phosphosulfolactate phosphatase [Bacteroidales bacterium]|nr:2-phosphosulfolactate phosphatase [Bacteroidales bacterium]HPR56802.1 2-phosphosulfolactate phosphatase [Bacteroidales bacterium]HRW96014.1 2-phosphosulfolactate phosphatase [Bacteroidales bacterium]
MPLKPSISVCFSPALIDFMFIKEETIVVVADILRATTSMISALACGAKSILPVSSLEKAREFKLQGFPVAAERDGKMPDFADFGNSAFEFMNDRIRNKTLIFSTTNGTVAIEKASKLGDTVLGAFSNISALAKWIHEQHRHLLILCSGWKNNFCLEDAIFAGALIEKLITDSTFEIHCDSAHAAFDLWKTAKTDLLTYSGKALHRERLHQLGADNIVPFSFETDTFTIVPILKNGELINALMTNQNLKD